MTDSISESTLTETMRYTREAEQTISFVQVNVHASTPCAPLLSSTKPIPSHSRPSPKLPPFFTRTPFLQNRESSRVLQSTPPPGPALLPPPRVRLYILLYKQEQVKETRRIYGRYPWAHIILINKQDSTFENAFWKQLRELQTEWSSLDMVGTLSWKAYKKINLNKVSEIVGNRSLWSSPDYVHFMDSKNPVPNAQFGHHIQTTNKSQKWN